MKAVDDSVLSSLETPNLRWKVTPIPGRPEFYTIANVQRL
jgi:hypothetical protein